MRTEHKSPPLSVSFLGGGHQQHTANQYRSSLNFHARPSFLSADYVHNGFRVSGVWSVERLSLHERELQDCGRITGKPEVTHSAG